MEHLVDQLIGSDSQEPARLAAKLDFGFLQDSSQRPMLLKNGCLRRLRKKVEVDFDGSKFHRFPVLFDEQSYFAKVITALAVSPDDLETYSAAVKLFQRRGHVMLMHQQSVIRRRNSGCIDLFQGGQ